MAESDSTPRRHLPHGYDKLPPDFHKVDTRPEGARESDEYEATHSAASKLFDLRYLIGGLFTVYGIMLTIYGFFTSAEERAKAADININLWLGIFMLLIGIFFLIPAACAVRTPRTYCAKSNAAAKPSAAAVVQISSMPRPLRAAAIYRRSSISRTVSKLAVLNVV
jgi:hypothetical protein